MDDVINKLLQETGLSYDDLLTKLQEYKDLQKPCGEKSTKKQTGKEIKVLNKYIENDVKDRLKNTVIKETDPLDSNNVAGSIDVEINNITSQDLIESSHPETSDDLGEYFLLPKIVSVQTVTPERKANFMPKIVSVTSVIPEKKSSILDKLYSKLNIIEDEKEHNYNLPKIVSIESIKESSTQALIELEDSCFSSPKIIPIKLPTSETESNMEETNDSEEASCSSIFSDPQDLRNILRQQLSSLRNMKKTSNLLDINTNNTKPIIHEMKKKRKSMIHHEYHIEKLNKSPLKHNSVASTSYTEIAESSSSIDLYRNEKSKENETPTKSVQMVSQEIRSLAIRSDIGCSFDAKDPGVQMVSKKSEKSPFISDSLDDFLNDSAQLKISYAIPKLGAEEGLIEEKKIDHYDKYFDRNLVASKTEQTEHASNLKKPLRVVKPKTLAEKRRQMEKLSKKTIASTSTQNTQVLQKIPRNSFVLFKNRVIRVSSRSKHEKPIAVINPVTPSCRRVKKNIKYNPAPIFQRRSLLSTLKPNLSKKIFYKPGPLSIKNLQDLSNGWMSLTRKLPKIYLEVIPEIKKSLHPIALKHLPIFKNPVITAERANFALSTLQTKQPTEKMIFKFLVPYQHNQELIIVRKRQSLKRKLQPDVEKCEAKLETEVKKVINNLLDYVEIKELAPTLIKEDHDYVPDERTHVQIAKPKKKPITRLHTEMKRLSCKVIDVASDEFSNCEKECCRLGCICKSLLCDSLFSDHCQELGCMFGCKCLPDPITRNKHIFTTQNKSVSATSVGHLDDHAKRNLAKMERDFTQTLIQTGDDVILVSNLGRNRVAPKKYSDLDFISPRTKKLDLMKCSIRLEKQDFSSLIPYCLYHNKYDCECKGQTKMHSVLKTNKKIPTIKPTKVKLAPPPSSEPRSFDIKSKIVPYSPPIPNPLESMRCARNKPVFDYYRKRNRHPTYRDRIFKLMASRNRLCKSSATPCPNLEHGASKNGNDSEFEILMVDDDSPTCSKIIKKSTSKRKQSMEIREDVPYTSTPRELLQSHMMIEQKKKEFALQRRKNKSAYRKIFPDEIRLNLSENLDLLSIIGPENSSLEFLRILPWQSLLLGYENGGIRIWSKNRTDSNLLCNIGNKTAPKNYFDINAISQKSEFVNWILTGKLPEEKPEKYMNVILVPKKNHFQISGLCMKKLKSQSLRLHCTHTDMNNETCVLLLTNHEYLERKLHYIDQIDGAEDEDFGNVNAELPVFSSVHETRWRMFFLRNEFEYLLFNRTNYSIKYNDLIDVVHMAAKMKSTVTIRNTKFTCAYEQSKNFGIYATPNYGDRLFIGPFNCNESFDISTVDSDNGRVNQKRSYWLYEKAGMIQPEPEMLIMPSNKIIVIDITEDDEEMEQSLQEDLNMNFLDPPFVEAVDLNVWKNRPVNRYIVTNIPYLGHFKAFQSNIGSIIIYWPGGEKAYKFPNVTFAKNSLIQILSQRLHTVPINFNINVVIMTNSDPVNILEVSPLYFEPNPEFYICGEFGVYNKTTVPISFLEDRGAKSIEDFLHLEVRADKNMFRLINLFALYFMSNVSLRKRGSDSLQILKWAEKRIGDLEAIDRKYEAKKKALEEKRIMNVKRLEKLKSIKLPTGFEKLINLNVPFIEEEKEVLSVVNKCKPFIHQMNVVETIELIDSDSDDERENSDKNVQAQGSSDFSSVEAVSILKPKFTYSNRSLLKTSVSVPKDVTF